MGYRWPNDPPGRSNHTISWAKHQQNIRGTSSPGGLSPITNYGPPPAGAPGTPQYQPAAPAAPPYDAELEARRTAGSKRRVDINSDLDVDLGQTASESGFQYNWATGAVGGFDPTNPFSQAALLMKARKERDQGENTSFAGSGQLYSGAYQTAKKETGSQYDRGYDTLRRGFQDYVKNYLRRKRDVNTVPVEELANLTPWAT